MIDSKILDILACPYCRGDVEYDAKHEKILCGECSREYQVKNGIPVMLCDAPISDDEDDETKTH